MKTLLTLIAVLMAAPALAQTPRVRADTPFAIEFTHGAADAAITTGYRIYVDGVKVGADVPVSARVPTTGVISATAPGVARGDHTLAVSAFNADNEGPKTAALAFTSALPTPGAPTNLKITLTVAIGSDGTATISEFALARVTP